MAYWNRPARRTQRGRLAPSPQSSTSSLSPSPSPAAKKAKHNSPIPQGTAQHLHEAGWRAPTESNEATFCVCSGLESEADMDTITQCQNRNCSTTFFHLSCMGLPDHPPRGVGWMCPTCRGGGGGADKVTGLYDQRNAAMGEDSRWRAWLRECEDEERDGIEEVGSDSTLSSSQSEEEQASPILKRKRVEELKELEEVESDASSEVSEEWRGR